MSGLTATAQADHDRMASADLISVAAAADRGQTLDNPDDGIWLVMHDDGTAHHAPVTDPAILDLERRLEES
jgi:hypothetical protein